MNNLEMQIRGLRADMARLAPGRAEEAVAFAEALAEAEAVALENEAMMPKEEVMGDEDILTLPEVAKLLKIHRNTVLNEIERGRLRAAKVGRQWRFTMEDVNGYLQRSGSQGIGISGPHYTMADAAKEFIAKTSPGSQDESKLHEKSEPRASHHAHVYTMVDAAKELRAASASPVSPKTPIEAFAADVLEAVAAAPRGSAVPDSAGLWHHWMGDDLCFISHAWRTYLALHPGTTLEMFKAGLLEAHKAGLLTLAAADMPATLDPEELRESVIQYRQSKFAFIRVQQPKDE